MRFASNLLPLLMAATVSSFAPLQTFTARNGMATTTHLDTVLYISSWGTKGSAADQAGANRNPIEDIQAYLDAPEPVEARANIDGTVLVSGLVKSRERTDQFIYDLLNNEESAFEFDKIVAFVDDLPFAKKRLLSRSARYTGLLDKLDFIQASSVGSLPSTDQLEGVKSWVAYLDEGDLLAGVKEVASIAGSASSVENIAVLVVGAVDLDASACASAVQALKDSGKKYTLVAVGNLEEHDEGKIPYKFSEFGTAEGVLASDAIFSRDEALRMVTECLQLESGANKALTVSEVYEADSAEARLVKGLREAGYARPQEIDHMINDGPAKYQKVIDEFTEKNPGLKEGVYTTQAWWEDEQFKKSVKKSSLRGQE